MEKYVQLSVVYLSMGIPCHFVHQFIDKVPGYPKTNNMISSLTDLECETYSATVRVLPTPESIDQGRVFDPPQSTMH